ncbi:membrane-anchored ubiquitin-fold protein 3-like isoform X3 [Diospyros lotus]|uniref:membrane-anchored ubiquitin-fold protein 3-like isoform X3 n=1 Tax=Diospyros lotus TaxID=55363 RepID=UPI002258C8DF|nr:membrane-anchored ubiquitin-fold protein 3-like isoform X3 [Diospyros lotus]
MAEEDVQIELKFRIYDGTDMAHGTYPLSTTVVSLKQRLMADWPQDKSVIPKSVSDIKLIHAGKFLENNKTLAESRVHFGDLPGGVTTMHVVVQQPPITNKNTARLRISLCRPNALTIPARLHVSLQHVSRIFCKYRGWFRRLSVSMTEKNPERQNFCSCSII